ncbi:MAG: hypothetical protein H7Z43_10445 [Clostridia bacterium]|nr:hypothetical protein [Deltaproteobacteria bacterium]
MSPVLLLAVVLSMKVAVPEKSVYHDTAKKVTLTLFIDAPPVLKAPGEKHEWHERLLPPSKMLVSSATRTVVYIGGIGDPGVSLGRIDLYDFVGTKTLTLDLHEDIPSLEAFARTWIENMGNFPWIASASLDRDEKIATIDVCERYTVTIDLVKRTHAVLPK